MTTATVITSDLNNALKRVTGALNTETITFNSKKGKLQLLATTKESYISMVIANSETDSKFKFTINKQIFVGVVKNRKGTLTLELDRKGQSINFSIGSYKGSLSCVTDESAEVKVPAEGSAVVIPNALQDRLEKIVKAVQLRDLLAVPPVELDIHVKLGPDGAVFSTFDPVHVSRLQSKTDAPKKSQFTILGSAFMLITGIANSKRFSLKFTQGQMFAYNDEFLFASMLMQTETSLTLKQVSNLCDNLEKPANTATVKLAAFISCMENVISIHDNKATFNIVVSNGKLRLRNSSNYGKIEDVLKSGVDGKDNEYSVNPHLLRDVLQCVSDEEITLNLVPDKYLYIVPKKSKLGRTIYVCNLS